MQSTQCVEEFTVEVCDASLQEILLVGSYKLVKSCGEA